MKSKVYKVIQGFKYWLYKDQANGNLVTQLIINLVECIC